MRSNENNTIPFTGKPVEIPDTHDKVQALMHSKPVSALFEKGKRRRVYQFTWGGAAFTLEIERAYGVRGSRGRRFVFRMMAEHKDQIVPLGMGRIITHDAFLPQHALTACRQLDDAAKDYLQSVAALRSVITNSARGKSSE